MSALKDAEKYTDEYFDSLKHEYAVVKKAVGLQNENISIVITYSS